MSLLPAARQLRPRYNGGMRDSYSGPAMTLGNMCALGIISIDIKCGCRREAIVDASGWPDAIEIPALRWRLKCSECGGHPIDVRSTKRRDPSGAASRATEYRAGRPLPAIEKAVAARYVFLLRGR
jgi:hypothetical protein